MEDMDKEQADTVEYAFDLDYDIVQAFCSHIVPKAVIWFTGDPPNIGMYFEPEYGEGEDNEKGGDDKGRGGMGFPCPALENMTGE